MDPETDCPICFECFEEGEGAKHQEWAAPCCGQSICVTCKESLRKCPFCRAWWHGEDEYDREQHPWRRRLEAARNITFVWTAPLLIDSLAAGARVVASSSAAAATTVAAAVSEASPAALAAGSAGAVAVAGATAVYVASKHYDAQSKRLESTIRQRVGRFPQGPWSKTVGQLFETVHWHLSPQLEGFPQVYHGSVWRSKSREEHQSQVRALSDASPFDRMPSPSEKLWADLLFCFSLWLDYNPHTANWGTCASYGAAPMHFCWHNRWREDLRHVVSDLASTAVSSLDLSHSISQDVFSSSKERASFLCMLGMLDHLLSWDVSTPKHGSSDLIEAKRFSYTKFCIRLKERFADAWAAAMAPPDADLDLESFDSHVQCMAQREVPGGFRGIWSQTPQ